jgi:hypothetical protein
MVGVVPRLVASETRARPLRCARSWARPTHRMDLDDPLKGPRSTGEASWNQPRPWPSTSPTHTGRARRLRTRAGHVAYACEQGTSPTHASGARRLRTRAGHVAYARGQDTSPTHTGRARRLRTRAGHVAYARGQGTSPTHTGRARRLRTRAGRSPMPTASHWQPQRPGRAGPRVIQPASVQKRDVDSV